MTTTSNRRLSSPVVLAVSALYEDGKQRIDTLTHRYHELVYHVDGDYSVKIGGRVYRGGPGTVYYYPPGLRHESRLDKGPIYVLGWREPARPRLQTGRPRMQRDPACRILLILKWMLEVFPPRDGAEREVLNALLRVLLHSMDRTEERDEPDRIRRARRYLEFHASNKVTLAEVAEVSGMSPFHLIREFKRATGSSPMRYLREIRMETACNILRASDLPLKSVARQVGLHDASHLVHVVRKATGKTPSQLRASFDPHTKQIQ